MSKAISITTSTQLIGINNITLSVIDDVIYINNNTVIDPGSSGSLSFYATDEGRISSTNNGLTWDTRSQTLNAVRIDIEEGLVANHITTNKIVLSYLKAVRVDVEEELVADRITTSKLILSDLSTDILNVDTIINTNQINVDGFLEFKLDKDKDNYSAKLHSLPSISLQHPEWEDFCIRTPAVDDYDPVALRINPERVDINRVLNLLPKTIKAPLGKLGDRKGDISIDQEFIYICIMDYTGRHKIWKKVKLLDWYEANKV